MFLKDFGLSLLTDNRETFSLKKLTVKQVFIMNKDAGQYLRKEKI